MTSVPELTGSFARVLSLSATDILTTLQDGVVIADLHGNVVFMNPAALHMHGFTDPAEGQRAVRDFRTIFQKLNTDGSVMDYEQWPLSRVLRGETLSSFESEVRRADGSPLFVASYSGNLVRSKEGKPQAAIVTIRDITDLRRSEREFQSAEEERLLAFEAANLGAWRRNLQTEEVFLSPRCREQFGIAPDKPLRTDDIYGAMLEEDREPTRAAVAEAIRNHSDYEAEYRVRDADGTERWLSVKGRPSYDSQGQPHLLQGVALDITDKHRAAEEFLALQRQSHHSQKLESLGVLAGGVAHDFNNLLTGILGNASLVLDGMEPENPNRAMLEEVVRAGERAADLTRQLLAYAGKGRFVTRLIDLSEMVRGMNRSIRTLIPRNVHVAHHLKQQLPALEGDPTQIEQVVLNLVLNAAEAIRESEAGTVLIETKAVQIEPAMVTDFYNAQALVPGVYVSLDVHDTGCGMSESTQGRIFDPFFTTKFTGRGLGLSAVLGIVRSHQGALRVRSEPGKGTSFTAIFPCSSRRLASQPKEELSGDETVLAVGHCHGDLRRLQDLGYAVLFCPEFRQAEAILKEGREPAAVVICSDDDSGTDFAAAVHKYRPGVHVILSSHLPPAELIRKHPGRRFSAFVSEHSRGEDLHQTIRQVLSFK